MTRTAPLLGWIDTIAWVPNAMPRAPVWRRVGDRNVPSAAGDAGHGLVAGVDRLLLGDRVEGRVHPQAAAEHRVRLRAAWVVPRP